MKEERNALCIRLLIFPVNGILPAALGTIKQ